MITDSYKCCNVFCHNIRPSLVYCQFLSHGFRSCTPRAWTFVVFKIQIQQGGKLNMNGVLFSIRTWRLVPECLDKSVCRRRETSLFYEGEFISLAYMTWASEYLLSWIRLGINLYRLACFELFHRNEGNFHRLWDNDKSGCSLWQKHDFLSFLLKMLLFYETWTKTTINPVGKHLLQRFLWEHISEHPWPLCEFHAFVN